MTLIVHDVSDEYARERLDAELLKCLFAHPEKESILVLNKTDKLKNKKMLLELVADLTGGVLNGKQFLSKEESRRKLLVKHSLRDYDYEKLFARTAEKMGRVVELESDTARSQQVAALLDELRACEDYLLKNLDKITSSSNNDAATDIEALENGRMTLEKLSGSVPPDHNVNPTKFPDGNKELSLVGSIVKSSSPNDSKPVRRIEDISPHEFKKDLLQTTDWHLYYQKVRPLNQLKPIFGWF